MSESNQPSRRQRVERGIYSRLNASGHDVLEIGWRDVQGKQRWRRVEGGIKAARAALATAQAEKAVGKRAPADPRLRFDAAADAWWQARADTLRPQTQATYTSALKHARRRFGRARLTDITPADVASFVAAQQRKGFKGWTIKGHLTVVSAIFKYAGRHLGYVGGNPIAMLERPEKPGIEDERPKRVLSPDELERLLSAVDDRYRLIFEVAAESGGRLGETLGLVWGNVDFDAATLTFTHQLDRHGDRVPLKTKRSRRCIEITPMLVAKLREHKMASGRSGPHDLVFVSRDGTAHDHRNIAGRVLARAVKRAGLEAVERDGEVIEYAPTFHNLRHSHGSALIASGWDIEEVSARLGHANTATTQRAYIHAYDAARRSDQRRDRLAALYTVENGEPSGAVVATLPTPRG